MDIFNGTLLDNLKYANPNPSFEPVPEACRMGRADEFIRHLDKGYCTVVWERGVRLSGGQKQRLGIAVREADKIVVLDRGRIGWWRGFQAMGNRGWWRGFQAIGKMLLANP